MEFKLDAHSHSVASGHAYSTIYENCMFAKQKGLEMIAITDHAPGLRETTRQSHFFNFSAIPKVVDGVRLKMGVELNIFEDGSVDFDEEFMANTNGIEVVIASFHPPCIAPLDIHVNTKTLIKVMENPYVQIIGHPGDSRYPLDLAQIVKKSKETGVLLEINEASLKSYGFRQGSDVHIVEMAKLCKKYECPVIVGSDAHFLTSVGDFTESKKLLEAIDFPQEMIANTSVLYFESLLEKIK